MHAEIQATGLCRVTHLCKTRDGLIVPLSAAPSMQTIQHFKNLGLKVPQQDVVRDNLVVNSGRQNMAHALGGMWETQTPRRVTPYVNRITLGTGVKSVNMPHLGNTGLVQELQKLNGTVAGTFLLEGPHEVSPDITFPDAIARSAGSGASVSIDSSGKTILTDASGNFLVNGVQLTDQVTLNNDPVNPLVMGVRAVVSATQLELHNPYGFVGAGLGYSIGTPGTQMLVSKLLTGNTFSQAEYGVAVLIHEAGLLLSNDALFNRVVFAPQDDASGILLQSDESNGVEVSVRFEWLITF